MVGGRGARPRSCMRRRGWEGGEPWPGEAASAGRGGSLSETCTALPLAGCSPSATCTAFAASSCSVRNMSARIHAAGLEIAAPKRVIESNKHQVVLAQKAD